MAKLLLIKIMELIIHTVPDFKGKARVCFWLSELIKGEPIRTAYGPKIECHLDDYTNGAAVFGWYGDVVFDVLKALPEGSVLVDIGANSGVFSLVAAHAVGEHGHVYAFEPQPAMFEILTNNIKSNRAENVTAINKAISSITGELSMSNWNPEHTGVAHFDPTGHRRVQSINPDKDMPELLEGIGERPLAVKIDVEGAESEVLESIGTLLARAHTVVIEINKDNLARFGSSPQDVCQTMDQHGFFPTLKDKCNHFDEVFKRS